VRMRTAWAITMCGVLLGGCGGVYSKHPASDAATTHRDERLVGFWRVDRGVEPALGPKQDQTILVVGRALDSAAGLEVVAVTLKHGGDKDGAVETFQARVLATTIAERTYASVSVPHDPKSGEAAPWVVLRYEAPDADTLIVRSLEEKTLAADVRGKAIAGEVEETKQDGGGDPLLAVTLKASTADLRAFLGKRGDAIFRADAPLVLRRLRVP
jgi:hypothetical protein